METEEFWKVNDEYHQRQGEIGSVEANIEFFDNCFSKILFKFNSVLELGAGEGRNIDALALLGSFELMAVDINQDAALKIPCADVFTGSIYDNPYSADLVLTKGLLIHIPPEDITKAYEVIYKASNKYILICEYYNPTPVMIPYRGEDNRLWKRDFAGEMMDLYSLKLIDYGFTYHKDGQDDLTHFLLEKM